MSSHDEQPSLMRIGEYIEAVSRRRVPRTNMLELFGWHRPIAEDHKVKHGVLYNQVVYQVPRSGGGLSTFKLSSDAEGGRMVRWSDWPGGYVFSARPGQEGTYGLMMLLVRGSEVIYEPDPGRHTSHIEAGRIAVEGANGWFASAVAADITTLGDLDELPDRREAEAMRQLAVTNAHDDVITPPHAETVEEARQLLNAELAKHAREDVERALGRLAAHIGIPTPQEWLSRNDAAYSM